LELEPLLTPEASYWNRVRFTSALIDSKMSKYRKQELQKKK
jgi:redox-sensitive bicupin YhaK (pirin superfamily)